MKILRPATFLLLLFVSIFFGMKSFNSAQSELDLTRLATQKDSLQKYAVNPPYVDAVSHIELSNYYDLQVNTVEKNWDRRGSFMRNSSLAEMLLVVTVFFGLLGGLVRILIDSFYTKPLTDTKFFILPALAALTGFIMYCITAYAPELFWKTSVSAKNPGFFMLAGLLGGLFTKTVYDRIEGNIK